MSSISPCSSPNYAISKDRVLGKSDGPLPEHWTLVKEWNIERRQPFESWRSLANSQMLHMHQELSKSLQRHPNAAQKWTVWLRHLLDQRLYDHMNKHVLESNEITTLSIKTNKVFFAEKVKVCNGLIFDIEFQLHSTCFKRLQPSFSWIFKEIQVVLFGVF